MFEDSESRPYKRTEGKVRETRKKKFRKTIKTLEDLDINIRIKGIIITKDKRPSKKIKQ